MEKGNKLHVGLSDIDYGNPMTNGGSQFLDAQFNLAHWRHGHVNFFQVYIKMYF